MLNSTHSSAPWLAAQPLATATALPPVCYTSDEFAALERCAVFAHSWQLVTRSESVIAPGDHAVAEIAGVPLVIVRGDDRELRALHNVCRHRAGPLALCDGRGARALVCRYHGWTYALDGRLRGAPDMNNAERFVVSEVRLPRAWVTEWHGLVFAALEGSPGAADASTMDSFTTNTSAMDVTARSVSGLTSQQMNIGASTPAFTDVIAGIEPRIAARDLTSYEFDRRVSYEIGCNWKIYVDNYLEGYHVAMVHPALARALDTSRYRTHLARWYSLQESPLQSTQATAAERDALYYFIYPNTMLNLLPGRMQTNRVVPLSTQRCRVDFDYFFRRDVTAEERAADRDFADQVQAEDAAICEQVQRGTASGSYAPGRLNPNQESGLWHFQELLRSAYRESMPEAA